MTLELDSLDQKYSDQVCNTVYEEVCEAAQPTYAGGRGGAGGASGGYGAAKAPACRQVPRQECKNVPKQVKHLDSFIASLIIRRADLSSITTHFEKRLRCAPMFDICSGVHQRAPEAVQLCSSAEVPQCARKEVRQCAETGEDKYKDKDNVPRQVERNTKNKKTKTRDDICHRHHRRCL